jgi:hypothetical protein
MADGPSTYLFIYFAERFGILAQRPQGNRFRGRGPAKGYPYLPACHRPQTNNKNIPNGGQHGTSVTVIGWTRKSDGQKKQLEFIEAIDVLSARGV